MQQTTTVILALCASLVLGDVYMHNPRGSNNRNCRNDNNDRRRNGNRLFDSQNNDKGGYSCPRAYPFKAENNGATATVNARGDITGDNAGNVYIDTPTFTYLEDSVVHVEWTNQHGCGDNENLECEIVLQYQCDYMPGWEDMTAQEYGWLVNENIRDGTPTKNNDGDNTNDEATTTIPENNNSNNCNGNNCGTDGRYGFFETHSYYASCKARERNRGLFTADQLPISGNNNNRAINTRQNPNGNRYGLECPEERDYYPYWHPTPFIDVAIGVNSKNLKKCRDEWAPESQNVKEKCYCDYTGVTPSNPQANNQGDCDAGTGTWRCAAAWNMPEPECFTMGWNRDNHLGNGLNGYPTSYNWTLPKLPAGVDRMRCALRMRYNITTGDFPRTLDRAGNCNPNDYDCTNSPIIDRDNREELSYKQLFEDTSDKLKLSFAVNTNQHARTFQDRSYVFDIAPKPAMCNGKITHNLNVRGKRGNIVQVYPSVEYDFVPQDLRIEAEDCVHVQWIGSDYNPNRNPNNAEGGPYNPNNQNEAKADRTNMVQMFTQADNYGLHQTEVEDLGSFFSDSNGRVNMNMVKRFALLDQDPDDCDTFDQLKARNPNNRQARERDPRNCGKLNSIDTPYFEGNVIKVYKQGTHRFMSTRNNNFSNRSQKMKIIVGECTYNCAESSGLSGGQVAGITIGVLGAIGAVGLIAFKRNPQAVRSLGGRIRVATSGGPTPAVKAQPSRSPVVSGPIPVHAAPVVKPPV